MPNSSPAAGQQLLLYQKYSDMARRSHADRRKSYLRMARDALRQAAKLDAAAVAHSGALVVAKAG
jgi:hypothetical protein